METDKSLPRFARMRARQLAGLHGFLKADEDDLYQELTLEYWCRMRRYDERRSSIWTFGRRVIDNHVATMIEAKKAQCRDYRLCQSVEDLGQPLRSILTSKNVESNSLPTDVQRVIKRLRPELGRLCRLLMKEGITQAARTSGLSRATLYRRLSELRGIFEAAGMRHYWPSSTGTFEVGPTRIRSG